MKIIGNMVGCYSPIGKTFIIEDESGNEIVGVVVDSEVIFTATDPDVISGKVYASDNGVSTGTLECTCSESDDDAQMFASSASGRVPEYERGVATSEFELYFETSAVGALQEG
jgi:hypothetical protein